MNRYVKCFEVQWVQKHNIWHSEDSVCFSISLDKDNAMGFADIGFAVKAFESPADRPRQRKVYTDLRLKHLMLCEIALLVLKCNESWRSSQYETLWKCSVQSKIQAQKDAKYACTQCLLKSTNNSVESRKVLDKRTSPGQVQSNRTIILPCTEAHGCFGCWLLRRAVASGVHALIHVFFSHQICKSRHIQALGELPPATWLCTACFAEGALLCPSCGPQSHILQQCAEAPQLLELCEMFRRF